MFAVSVQTQAAAKPDAASATVDVVDVLSALQAKGLQGIEDALAEAMFDFQDTGVPVNKIANMVKAAGASAAASLTFAKFISSGEYRTANRSTGSTSVATAAPALPVKAVEVRVSPACSLLCMCLRHCVIVCPVPPTLAVPQGTCSGRQP